MLPNQTVPLTDEATARGVLRLIDALEEHDDVQAVSAHFDIPDDALQAVVAEAMDLAAARDFVRSNHRAVLTTRRANGDPQLSPVVCSVDPEGRVVVSTRETALKVKNLRRDPRASLC